MLPATEAQVLEPSFLTTPIAYVSGDSVFKDPFRNQAPPAGFTAPPYFFPMYNYVNWDDVRYKDNALVHQYYGEWRMAGAGPDKWFYNGTFTGPDGATFQVTPYDASNGTISLGDIFRTQKDSDPRKFN